MRGPLSGSSSPRWRALPTLGNVEAGALASLTSLRFSIVSGGILCIAGCWLFIAAAPALLRYDSQQGRDVKLRRALLRAERP